jgi:hypothetical protein
VLPAGQTHFAHNRFGGFVVKYMGDGVLVYFGDTPKRMKDAEVAGAGWTLAIRAGDEKRAPAVLRTLWGSPELLASTLGFWAGRQGGWDAARPA